MSVRCDNFLSQSDNWSPRLKPEDALFRDWVWAVLPDSTDEARWLRDERQRMKEEEPERWEERKAQRNERDRDARKGRGTNEGLVGKGSLR